MKIVFLGLSEIVIESAVWCKSEGYECLIICNKAQGSKIYNSISLNETAKIVGVDVVYVETTADLKNISKNTDLKQTITISVGAPWIINDEIIKSVFNGNILNLHGTRLPKERGGTLFSWQILSGQRSGICLLHKMNGKIDNGPVIAFEEFIYPAHCRKPIDFINHYNIKNVDFLRAFIESYTPEIFNNSCNQPEYLSTYWPRLMASVNGWIDWSWNFTELERFILAFDEPYDGARTTFRNKTIIIRDVYSQSSDGYTHPFQNGIVFRNNGKWLSVAVNGGELLICSVTDLEGNDMMKNIKPGDRFFTHANEIAKSKSRVIKTSKGLDIQTDI
jgi:methionyl-tRNA formyltransferase